MIPDTRTIKKFSLDSLKPRWTQTFAVCSILLGTWVICAMFKVLLINVFKVDMFFSPLNPENWYRVKDVVLKVAVDSVSFLLSLFFLVPLGLGVLRWFWRAALGADDPVGNVFYYFSSLRLYFRAVSFYLLFVLRVLALGFVSFLPGYAAAVLTDENFYRLIGVQAPEIINTFYALQFCLFIIGFVFFVPLIIRYFPSPVLLFSDEKLTPNEAYRHAARISSGRKVEFVSLVFSFFGWLLLSALGVTIIFTLPYFLNTVVLYSSFVVNEYNYQLQVLNQGA
ncbi:MAG TPA: DUF975 family protein [Clostridiales bacterium]|nr:DUF975 family protein [Clostridiales bacterium]